MSKRRNVTVGEIRPSQLMHTYGVGSIVDLPKLSVIVTGLEDWPTNPEYARPIVEDRLLLAVRYNLPEVRQFLSPPLEVDTGLPANPLDNLNRIGVPVATFPRWMVCPQCRVLAHVASGIFELDTKHPQPDRIVYKHSNCNKSKFPPEVIPARFLVACEAGHLDDFPWVDFVHQENPCTGQPWLRLIEYGASGEARDLEVSCDTCAKRRRLSEAFGEENRKKMPLCQGRRPHLRDYDPDGCEHRLRTVILGASNMWFPVVLSALAIPAQGERLTQLVDENWAELQHAASLDILQFMRQTGRLGVELATYPNEQILEAVVERREQDAGVVQVPSDRPDLKEPEWQVFTTHDSQMNGPDFQLRPVSLKRDWSFNELIDQVVLVERLRVVNAMIGFTRLDAIGELTDVDQNIQIDLAPLARRQPNWLPAYEVRGEGIFIRFNESSVRHWLAQRSVDGREDEFLDAHMKWRRMRRIEPPADGFPGMRYVLLHTFSHALMRQLSLECGYNAASLSERIYSRPGTEESGPMAGILIYTAAPDSEGTLGGLVQLGEPETLERHIAQALNTAHFCASDPLCAERPPSRQGRTLHAAACHACLFAPETSCERGNRYLDRSTLVATVERDDLAYFV